MNYKSFLKDYNQVQNKVAILLYKENAKLNITELLAISTIYYTVPNHTFERSIVIEALTQIFEGWEMSENDKHKFSTYATRFLSGLSDQGYISKEKDENDRRKTIYHLTPKAIKLIEKTEKLINK